jgi:dipeptidyl aminopeptidase/acylaminoacyl peptidase
MVFKLSKNGIFTRKFLISPYKPHFLNMKRSYFVLLLCVLLSMPGLASEKLVVSQWLTAGALPLQYPAFHQVQNVEGKTFSNNDLLSFNHLNLKDYFPEEGLQFNWFNGQPVEWVTMMADENGFLVLHDGQECPQPQMVYLAAYLKADRWMSAQLEVRSNYMLEAYLDGERIGSKTSIEKEENTTGKVTKELKLTRGTHLLLIKALKPSEAGLPWKLTAQLEMKEPFTINDLMPVLIPANIKNINHVMDGLKISSVEPSNDGRYYAISFRQSLPPDGQSESWTDIRKMEDNSPITSFRHSRVSRMTWLPGGIILSYVSSRNGKSTIYRHNLETGEISTLLEDEDKMGSFRWAPDGSYIIYSVREDGSGSDATMRRVLGMQDRQGQWRNRSFLYKYDVATGLKTRLTYGNVSTSLMDISPDGQKLLISLSRPDYQERPYTKSDLLLLDLNTLAVDTLLTNQRWGASASFSPDGKQLLATGGPSAFDGAGENIPGGTIPNNYDRQAYIYDLETRTVKCITLNFDPSVSSVYWHPADNNIYISTTDEDYQRLYRYNIRRERFSLVNTGLDMVNGMNFAGKSLVATFLGSQTNAPAKAYSINLSNDRVQVIEDTESKTYQNVQFGETRNWNFQTSTGVDIKGRYYLPPNFKPEKKYPVIVYYYGGTTPVGRSFGGRYPFNLWAGNGYVVYVLQPSGAIGFGQEFSAAHVNNWGLTVADEIIEATRGFLQAHPFTDASKVGCAGASYGGFMTMLLMTRTDLFTASIAHAGISSISSYWGEGYWGYSYNAEAAAESFPWNSPEIYVDQSPLFRADKVSTPILLLHGDSDTNVPPGESIQFYTALKMLGKPVELILVKGEDHHILTYGKRIEWHNTIMAWWDKYLKDQPEWWNELYPDKNY